MWSEKWQFSGVRKCEYQSDCNCFSGFIRGGSVSRFRRDPRQLEDEEDQWFNDDDEYDEPEFSPTTSPPTPISTSVTTDTNNKTTSKTTPPCNKSPPHVNSVSQRNSTPSPPPHTVKNTVEVKTPILTGKVNHPHSSIQLLKFFWRICNVIKNGYWVFCSDFFFSPILNNF